MNVKNALLSVYDKTGIAQFAGALVALGYTIYASGGTATVLKKASIPVVDVADLVGGGAILGHRVVTLSREVHAALLARPIPEDLAELDRLGIPFIDLVCVDLYPLSQEIDRPGSTLESVIDMTDIGGPTLLRSAAKGRRIVVSSRALRGEVLDWLQEGQPKETKFRRYLAGQAEALVASYALESAKYLSEGGVGGIVGQRVQLCEYGENAWQEGAALYSDGSSDPLGLLRFTAVAGRPPSYNNLAEILFRQLQTMTHIAAGFDLNFGTVPFIAIGTKHGNACGAAAVADSREALRRMLAGDHRAIFGGLVMVNFDIDEEVAELLLRQGVTSGKRLLDAICAPSFTSGAIQLLERRGAKCRLLVNPALASLSKGSLDKTPIIRAVRGGWLQQPNYTFVWDLNDPELEAIGRLTPAQAHDTILAWAICATSNSNTITLVRDGQLLGNGVGQQDRVSCCELAIKRAVDAGHKVKGAVAASDSFFPFEDGPEVLAHAGVTVILATSGSVRDQQVRDVCEAEGVNLVRLPDRRARSFFGH